MKYISSFLIILISFNLTCLEAQKANKKFYITGRVVDSNNNPVSNAIILINNKRVNQTTDENGFYKIKVSPTDTMITVFMLNGGMKDDFIKGRTVINFSLPGKAEASQIKSENNEDEQEINIGYGTMKKKNLTNTVEKIDGTNSKYESYSNIYDMIKGEVPGVQVVGKKITIRGPSSINLSSEPLIIVNGVEVSSIDDISPQQVKSIEVLKGSAASIYGARGAGGVILITLLGSEKN
ncbi:MAG: TonB-dependent receptor plug domain-containing protein [Bacteroidales bacterium]|nr:TonB-dependent receptor plug domain-containing protein [Bacteroidales bacterium]